LEGRKTREAHEKKDGGGGGKSADPQGINYKAHAGSLELNQMIP
jgi:hypothetical protein